MSMGLQTYRRKRNFRATPEPRGKVAAQRRNLSFVVQKHAARQLHYDFRLEIGGVLASWAIPRGPSLNPKERRLAVHVEDHPLEYGKFEGDIPRGHYGAGSVEIWDRGTWVPKSDPRTGLRAGKLKFTLNGKRLSGGWSLVRMGGRNQEPGKDNWLLIKERDEASRNGHDGDPKESPPGAGATGGKRSERPRLKPRKTRRLPNAKISPADPSSVESSRLDVKPGEIAGVKLSHPDRVLYPEQGITKQELAEYYEKIADWILPHVSGRPLTLVRCPAGHRKQCFYQRHADERIDSQIRRLRVREDGALKNWLVIDSLAGLVALVQMGVLEIHTWGSREENIERPDRMIFDLDPDPSLTWESLRDGARRVRDRLAQLGLAGFLKTTGGKGLHVVVPIKPKLSWSAIKDFTGRFAESMAREAPDVFVATMSKSKRRGKIFIDYLRNSRTATAVCAYSTRARSGAPVSLPLGWDELAVDVRADHFNIRNVPQRLAKLGEDPWHGFEAARRSISKAVQKQ